MWLTIEKIYAYVKWARMLIAQAYEHPDLDNNQRALLVNYIVAYAIVEIERNRPSKGRFPLQQRIDNAIIEQAIDQGIAKLRSYVRDALATL